MREIDVGDCVTCLDETGCRRVGNVSAIVADIADVRVPGWPEPTLIA